MKTQERLSNCNEEHYKSRVSSVGIAIGHGLDGRGSVPGRSKRFFSSPQHPDRIWAHPASYTVGVGESFPCGKATGA
jgi:hypothetical protein